jgi:hypothetical protein
MEAELPLWLPDGTRTTFSGHEPGGGKTIRRLLLQESDVHMLPRPPAGSLYAHGGKANVLFF